MKDSSTKSVPQAQLTLFRSICIIVGIIVGAGIFESPPDIANNLSDWGGVSPAVWLLLIWVLGGALSLIGAVCYAELATAYPREGGDYVYLNRAYGSWCGFLFGWARLTVIQGGSLGAMAYVFGHYATQLISLGPWSETLYAALAVVVLTIINILGVREGTLTQNVLTTVKVLGLAAVFVVAFLSTPERAAPGEIAQTGLGGFALAMVFVLFTYGGWNEIAYVAAEVKSPRRNILRSLVLGVATVTLVYVLVNGAFLYSLGFEGLKTTEAVAADVLEIGFGETGAKLIAAMVVISALGAVNGLIFTSPRVYYAVGKDYRLFAALGRWNQRFGTPVAALVFQAVIILLLIGGFAVFGSGERSGFEKMVVFTAAVFWGFLVLTGIALFVLRYKDRDVERPYRVFGYPVIPILFVLSSAYMAYSSARYGIEFFPYETVAAIGVFLIGVPLYWLSGRRADGV